MVQYTDKNGKTRVDLIEIKPKHRHYKKKPETSMTKHPYKSTQSSGKPLKPGARQKVYTLKLSQKTRFSQNNRGRKTQTYIINNNMKIEYTKTPRDVVEFDDDVPLI